MRQYQKMEPAQKQNISAQHRYFNNHTGRTMPHKLTFEQWFEDQKAHYEQQGVKFYTLEEAPGEVEIHWPGKKTVIRSIEVFRPMYEEEYLKQGVSA